MSNWNKKPDDEKIYRWTEFFTSWTITSEIYTRAHVQENKSIYLSIYLSVWKPFWKRVYVYIYIYVIYRPGGLYWEKLCPNTDRKKHWDLKVSGKVYFSLQRMCVEVGRVRVNEARDRFLSKTKHYIILITILINLPFRIRNVLCLGKQFMIWVSNKDKRIDELDIKSHRKKKNTAKIFFGLRLVQSSGISENCTKAL